MKVLKKIVIYPFYICLFDMSFEFLKKLVENVFLWWLQWLLGFLCCLSLYVCEDF